MAKVITLPDTCWRVHIDCWGNHTPWQEKVVTNRKTKESRLAWVNSEKYFNSMEGALNYMVATQSREGGETQELTDYLEDCLCIAACIAKSLKEALGEDNG